MVFDHEEKAERVKVIFDRVFFPTFQEATEGEQVTWAPTYSAEFVKNGNELTCLC
jgi:dsRNA-specific ribonuclease